MGKYVINLPNENAATVDEAISLLIKPRPETYELKDKKKQVDKRFEDNYIWRWRVLAMLRNIRNEIESGEDVAVTINNYIRFVEKLDEKKWEEEFCAEM